MSEWIKRTLSKVEIQKLIGRGGMAEVYLGRHTTLNRPMAVKILHAHMTDDAHLRSRFKDEAQSVAALRHPNVVQVFDFDVFDGRPYIVMELLDGMALSDYLTALHNLGITLPLDTVARLISSIGSALDYAHGQGIIHRDVKPANIILRQGRTPLAPGMPLAPDIEPILTDFGVAHIANATTETASGTILGTPAYMSPEQVRGERVDHRSDIYSLGIILYEMLSGVLPFDNETDTPASVLYKQVNQDPPPLPNVSPAIQTSVLRALAKDRENRYQRARDLARDLMLATRDPSAASSISQSEIATRKPPKETYILPAEPQTSAESELKTSSPTSTTIQQGPGRMSTLTIVLAFGLGALVLTGGVLLGSFLLRDQLLLSSPPATQEATQLANLNPDQTLQPTLDSATLTADVTSVPTEAGLPATDGEPRGRASVRDGALSLQLDAGDVASGEVPHVWLLASDELDPDSQTPPLHVNSIGAVTLLGSVIQVDVDAINSNLLGRFDSLVIHFEPAGVEPSIPAEARFFGQIDLEAARLVQLINEVKLDQPLSPNLLNWVTGQSVAYNSHSGFAVESIRSASLGGSQLHSEHVINITEGRGSDLYRDWNNDGALEDPGDTVGMLPYLSLMFHIADSQAQEGTEISQLAERLAQEAERLIREITFTREAARQITLADSIDEITGAGWDTELSQALTLKADIDDFLIDAQALDIRLSFSIFETNP